MYHRELQLDGHTHRFVISASTGSGWELREERDAEVLRVRQLLDWHRVERARLMFSTEAARLKEAGWIESPLHAV